MIPKPNRARLNRARLNRTGLNRTEVAVSVLAAVLLQLEIWVFDPDGSQPARAALALIAAGALALMRSKPFLAYLVNGFAVYGLIGLGVPSDFYQWTNFAALVMLSTRDKLRPTLVGLALGFVGIAFYFWRFPGEGNVWTMLFVMALYLVGVLIGRAQQNRLREEVLRGERDLSEARLAVRAAEAELVDERTRIARELHDIVGHAVNLMVVQAGAGERATDAVIAAQTFRTIANTGRSALLDLDRMLSVLAGESPRSALPTLAGLKDLVDEFRTSGLEIEAEFKGDLDRVPASIGLAGYRIVQEALTNVLKHSRASTVDVVVEAASDLRISVADDGTGGDPEPGRGMRGMKERAELHGGSLSFSSSPEGGLLVETRIPLP